MNRRDFLKLMGASAGAVLATSQVIEALAAPDLPAPLRSAALAEPSDPIWHALNRVTFGPRPGQVDAVRKMGWQAFLEQQLAPEAIKDDASEQRLSSYATLGMSVEDMITFGMNNRKAIVELDAA